ncbi:hypothetical protein BGX28_007474 [Mortierella sp. GBA30]|nr:hypothetical protein BGX28_007474 [Mortierella sp. GBA30]
MELHHQYNQHHIPSQYAPVPGAGPSHARGSSHIRTHSRSSSGSYPQHVSYPVPPHEIAAPGFHGQGPAPATLPPSMMAPSELKSERHIPRYSSSQPLSGYHVPPPQALSNHNDPHAWSTPVPYEPASEQHLHQQSVHRYVQDTYTERVEPIRFPAPAPQQANVPVVVDEEEDNEGEMHRHASEMPGPIPEDEHADASKCPDCGKVYKHATSLMKHRWEHSVYWKPATKFLLSKHQQVQLMEAAAILLGMDETRESDKDPIVCMFSKQRGAMVTGTSISAASPSSSSKSLSASPPPLAERGFAVKEESGPLMIPPVSTTSYHGRVSNTTRHSVASTTSTASSLTSTPPSLAPDDESVAEVEEESSMAPAPFRHHHPQHLQHQQHQHQRMIMGMETGPEQKHAEPEYYSHDARYPPYHHQPLPHPQQYTPYYHNQH